MKLNTKKLIWMVALCFVAIIGLSSFTYNVNNYVTIDVREKELHGHIYVIATSYYTHGGVSIIHSEACKCKTKK